MAYYNDIFIEKNGVLELVGSCTGSSTPLYFKGIKNLSDFYKVVKKLKIEKHTPGDYFCDHHPWPWEYKKSDNIIIAQPSNKKWFEFWRPKLYVYVVVEKYEPGLEKNEVWAVPISKWIGDSYYPIWNKYCFLLPQFKK